MLEHFHATIVIIVITGLPTHSVGGVVLLAVVVVCNTAHMQRNSPGGSTRRQASSVTYR